MLRAVNCLLAVATVLTLTAACSKSHSPVINVFSQAEVTEQLPAQILNEPAVYDEEESYEEEGGGQEPAWTYYERLSYAFGADSTCVGLNNDMDYPDWYSGCFVNDIDRLTINVIGDTLHLRPILNNLLDGDEFDLGHGLYSKKEALKVKRLLTEAIEKSGHLPNMTYGLKEDGTIEICIEGKDDSVIEDFRKNIFDSPLLRFKRSEEVGIILL
ncbi:MAG: hypothetical protein K2H47_00070 [Muribaculaceae bacterium]|nr:hypothetical protein [Muribaculaceae bacterium]